MEKTNSKNLTEAYVAETNATEAAILALSAQVDNLLDARGDLANGSQPSTSELVSFTGTATVNDGPTITAMREALKAIDAKLKAVAPKAERKASGERALAYKLVYKDGGADVYAEDSGLGFFKNEGQKTLRSAKYASLDLSKVQMIEIATGKVIRDGAEFTVTDAPGTAKAA